MRKQRWLAIVIAGTLWAGPAAAHKAEVHAAVLVVDEATGAVLEAKLEAAEPGEQGKVYAESGLWYDALASVSQAIEHAPREARLRELRAGLLEQVGLREAATYDRQVVRQNAP